MAFVKFGHFRMNFDDHQFVLIFKNTLYFLQTTYADWFTDFACSAMMCHGFGDFLTSEVSCLSFTDASYTLTACFKI